MKETHDGAFYKSQRVKQISKEIARLLNKGRKINIERLLNWIEMEIGLSRKRARQYLDLILKTHETWMEEKGHIRKEKELE